MPPATFRMAHPLSSLRRPSGALHLGLDTDAAALVPSAPDGAETALGAFRVWRTIAEAARLGGVDARWLAGVVHDLVARGTLVAHDPDIPLPRVTVLGGGPLARQILTMLAESTAGPLRAAELPPFVSEVPAHPPSSPEPRIQVFDHWRDAVTPSTHLVVVAARTVEPDRTVTDFLRREGTPHVVARIEPERAVVGPFVIPGLSPCQRCLDLRRCDIDPDWPMLLAQQCRTWQPSTELAAAWAASTVTAQCLGWLQRNLSPPLGTTMELPSDSWRPETRAWPAHARCGCVQDW